MSKGQKPMIGARIPYDWMVQIEAICRETGKTSSEVVQEALAEYLGRTDINSVTSMSKRLAALERKYQKLAQLV